MAAQQRRSVSGGHDEADTGVWYVGYGSNLLRSRFQEYLDSLQDLSAPKGTRVPDQVIQLEYPLYFAGWSKRWRSAVAFVETGPKPGTTTVGRAYWLSVRQLSGVVGLENGVASIDVGGALATAEVGDAEDVETRSKYNCLIRLPDLEDERAFTLTTSRDLTRAAPGHDYRDVVRRGLIECGLTSSDADAYLAERVEADG